MADKGELFDQEPDASRREEEDEDEMLLDLNVPLDGGLLLGNEAVLALRRNQEGELDLKDTLADANEFPYMMQEVTVEAGAELLEQLLGYRAPNLPVPMQQEERGLRTPIIQISRLSP